ncbi:alpha/beta hydrolase [Flavihumibacter rivuli]|uniref:alpha/beta hydrolase n=1 Tax=Flavihumibacter rivuli TaxID=2838156 RepID=UPI001BDEEAD6|nr:alpha/beta hydrolase [Flavihumibacter rivuli]ULQ55248.1 alpha/beta hydrolase [Flavihumibacter rivuli]
MKQKPLLLTIAMLLFAVGTYSQACGTRVLDPQIAYFLKIVGYKDQTLEQLRSTPIEQLKYPQFPLIPYPKEDVQRLKITSDSISVLVFNPLHKENLPVIIHYHGGGFISPLVQGLEYSLWQDAKTYGAIVFAVDYRVAPEHRFPAAVDDSYKAFKWISQNAQLFGGDTSQLILMGNSAGANLVAVITQRAKKENTSSPIKLQVLNGLPADLRPENMEKSVSYQQNALGYFQTKAMCYFAVENYAPDQFNDPEVSPILGKDFKGLPPAVIINAEFDPLREDGVLYAEKLRNAGVKVWEKCFAGQIHCLIGLMPGAEPLKEFERIVKSSMNECLGK